MTKLNAVRALTAYIGRRVVRMTTIVAGILAGVLLILTWALAHFVSPWWWLLLIPISLLLLVFLTIRFIVLLIVRRIYPNAFRADQSQALRAFSEKIQGLVEARGTPPQLFVFITIKDILIHRDIVTIKKLLRDSVSLKQSFSELEKLF